MNTSKHLASLARLQNQFRSRGIKTASTRSAFLRTMSSSSKATDAPTDTSTTTSTSTPSQPSQHQPLPLPEPSSSSTSTTLNVDGPGVKLDHLGPLVVNKDGSLSRIANWETMAQVERENTLRILGKRNQLRLGGLREGEGGGEGKGE